MFVSPLIERKRDGAALTAEEWSALIAAYVPRPESRTTKWPRC